MRTLVRAAGELCLALSLSFLPLASGHAEAARSVSATAAPTPQGLWITANHDAVIQIAPCGNGLCGYIVGMYLGPNDPTPKDWAGTSQCRLTIIQAAPQTDSDGQPFWTGGITDPRNGTAYNAIIRVNAENQLLLRGYVGLPILGETQTWTPYHGAIAENCRLSSQPVG
jgi:uncharacterized protein (DUF2147 family)